MIDDLRFSRPVASAATLGELAPDRNLFKDKRVLLTGETSVLATDNGRECFLSSLRLLVRVCSDVSVSLPAERGKLLNECRRIADREASGVHVEFLGQAPDFKCYDAILCIGETARPHLPWTVINSNGWLARVSSGATNLPSNCEQQNPIAALAASCLGVTEIFKRLIRLKEKRGLFWDGLIFSLYSYRSGETDPGPRLPGVLPLHLLIVGAGAIGNGMVHLLRLLPVSGQCWVVDQQVFKPENLGTCLLIGPNDLETSKAVFAAERLNTRLEARGFHEDFARFKTRLGVEIPYPKVVITGLDNIDARHEVQRIWPDLIVDGAISDFGCQASRHPWEEDTACLICLFRHPHQDSSELQSRATGLSMERVRHAMEPVLDEDVHTAPQEKQSWLRARIGHQICSVIQEGVANLISQERQREGFQPSVPFVACFSASMVIAELVKFIAGWTTPLEPRFQLDLLRGPASGLGFPQRRRRDCVCFAREQNIETIRKRRN